MNAIITTIPRNIMTYFPLGRREERDDMAHCAVPLLSTVDSGILHNFEYMHVCIVIIIIL